ncbi:ATPase, T2SS/T4P/T4SS family [Limihaloglobus sulfuriphilus]|nr:ATPase, T2SS/T4P/T4SS family [Limihaloglobus sulfuriphilus]
MNFLLEVSYGSYTSPFKLGAFILIFFIWLALINWINHDARSVQTKEAMWTGLFAAAGLIGLFLWIALPVFVVGFLIYLLATGTVALSYIIHRNSRVSDHEKVLTINHIKNIFSNEEKSLRKSSRGFTFVTANGNPIDIPEPKTKESFGYGPTCSLMDDALYRRANIVTLIPGSEDTYKTTFIIDGVAHERAEYAAEDVNFMLYFLKQLADLDVNEHRKPQKGKFTTRKNRDKTDWELFTAGSTAGEQIKIVKQEESQKMTFEDLGFSEEQIPPLKELKPLKHGLFLVAGPKGSGVTTALYTMVRNHDPFLNSIVTLEKRPADTLDSVTQNIYKPNNPEGKSYGMQLQTLLRYGPDIVAVGDCSDPETAKIAATNSSSKLIYVSIEAANTVDAVAKWSQMVGDKKLALKNLVGVVSTRLFRNLCHECREAYEPNPETLRKLNIKDEIEFLYRPGEVQYTRFGKPVECEHCQGTGYYGRLGVLESIVLKKEAREQLIAAGDQREMLSILRRNGLVMLHEQAMKKVIQGELAINEVIRELKVSAPKKK